MEQELYWREIYQLKVHSEYIEQHLSRIESIDRRISFFLAFCSSASIGAWAVWNPYAMVWGAIIAVSQVVQAVRPVLRFQDRLKSLAQLRNNLEELFVFADTRWPEIAKGRVNAARITSLRAEVRKRKLEFLRKAFPGAALYYREQFLAVAEQRADQYFANFYQTGGTNGNPQSDPNPNPNPNPNADS